MLYSIILGGVSTYQLNTVAVADNHSSVFYTYVRQFRKNFYHKPSLRKTYIKLVP